MQNPKIKTKRQFEQNPKEQRLFFGMSYLRLKVKVHFIGIPSMQYIAKSIHPLSQLSPLACICSPGYPFIHPSRCPKHLPPEFHDC